MMSNIASVNLLKNQTKSLTSHFKQTKDIMKKVLDFFKNHMILTHLLLMAVVGVVLLWVAISYMDNFTRHGVEEEVPDIKNLTVEEATPVLEKKSLSCQIIDSIYNKNLRPGIIIEQTPRAGSTIKHGKDIYVIINTISPRQVPFPEITDISYRQAMSMLEGLGFPAPDIECVVSQYKDLVVEAKYRDIVVKTGDKYPITTRFTIVVGKGPDYIGEEVVLEDDIVEDDNLN